DIPTLENFAFGDTPTAEAIAGLLGDVFAHPEGERFTVSEYELSVRHDVRPLVLKTILTYLELDGFLEQGTPFYAGYRVRPASGEWDDVYATFDADRAEFLRRVIASGKEGRVWTSVDPESVRGEERERVVDALGYLEQQGLVELKVADVRQRFSLLKQPPSREELCDRLAERFNRREQSEAERIERVVALVEHVGCQVQALIGYLGETRPEPCGHCTCCLAGSAQSLPEPAAPPDVDLDRAVLDELTLEYPTALGSSRQRARFLCGLSSPATTRAKLSRHELFGTLAEHRFADVLGMS
ncbi:MAG: RecQ family zinc-binding domain-containing protein, partial [Gaiellaceae bacterium]